MATELQAYSWYPYRSLWVVLNISQVLANKLSDRLMETFARLHIVILKLRNHLSKRLSFYKRQFQDTI